MSGRSRSAGCSHVSTRRARGAVAATSVLVVSLLLGGCATMTGGPAGDLSRSMDEVSSATQTALLALTQDNDGKSTDAVTGTTLDDMLKAITQAETDATEVDATTSDEARIRSEVLDATRASIDAINAARLALAAGDDGEAAEVAAGDARATLDAAASATKELSEKLEKFQ